MSLKILPNEAFVLDHGALIQTRCPKEHITDAMVRQRVVALNLSVGDYVKVQCTNHNRTTILHYAEYLVFNRSSEFVHVDVDDRISKQYDQVSFGVIQVVPWTITPAGKIEVVKEKPDEKKELQIQWNPGKQKHQVLDGAEIVFEHKDKSAAQKYKEENETEKAA